MSLRGLVMIDSWIHAVFLNKLMHDCFIWMFRLVSSAVVDSPINSQISRALSSAFEFSRIDSWGLWIILGLRVYLLFMNTSV